MILKIMRERDKQDCWILDDIRKISIGKKTITTGADLEDSGREADIYLLDRFAFFKECGTDDPKAIDQHPYVELICRRSDDKEFLIVFDTTAYLCNDSGETIEKITV